jgi:hypothetical protein
VSLIKHYRELNGCHIPYKYRKHGTRGKMNVSKAPLVTGEGYFLAMLDDAAVGV